MRREPSRFAGIAAMDARDFGCTRALRALRIHSAQAAGAFHGAPRPEPVRCRLMRHVLHGTVAAALAFLLAGAAPAAEPEIEKVAWLAGCWASDDGEPGSDERWMPLAGGTMLGVSRTIRQGKTVAFEFMEIRHLADGKLAFVAHPSGQDTAIFTALRLSDLEVVFENKEHDFPQRVAYAKDGDSKLRARIEGTENGTVRVIEFPMTRTSCD